tara:strand:+ start:1956 stop:2315 length:360 start_codon:yes stop_codon:yes gene_type:complete
MIKEINREELEKKCLLLIGKTFVDLGQTKPANEKIVLAEGLRKILITKFPKLSWQAVEVGFEDGVMESNEFHLCIKTMYKWLYAIRSKIWMGWHNEKHGAKHAIDNKTKALLNNQKLIG